MATLQVPPTGITKIHRRVIHEELFGMSPATVVLYITLASLASKSPIIVGVTVDMLANRLNASKSTIIRARKALLKKRLISVHSDENSTTYTVRTVPEDHCN